MNELRGADLFAELVEPHRDEVHAHCYRMLGSVHDADDALQETLVRAWRGIEGLRGRASSRSWLYAIANNVCLTELSRRTKRVLPHDFGPASDGQTPPGQPLVESVWIEPYPDQGFGLTDGRAAPEARYDQREAIELAFVAALQHLSPNQRCALILREVLGFSAQETAEMLDTTVASVTSALQRARVTVEERVPSRTQQATLRTLGDRELGDLVGRYMSAWERNDVDDFAAMLAEDATFAMPPMATWYRTRDGIAQWARGFPMSGLWRWRATLTRANGQPALAFYAWDEDVGAHLPFALNVLTLHGRLVSDVTAFIVRETDASDPDVQIRLPERPFDDRLLTGVFERFGLPDRLS
jgi:RNA polymerase sigma-70 factor, ECF subfamily